MTQYDIYTLILCIIVFVLLISISIACIVIFYKMYKKLIRAGTEDDKIIKEYTQIQNKKRNKASKVADNVVTIFLCVVFTILFAGSLYINCTQNAYFDNIPTYRVVMTGSMAKKHKDNEYLTKNGLDNQIQTFDLIATYKIPNVEDLKLYDVVVYEVDDMLLVHRIVGIEEPNEKHPNEYYFLLQGDAVGSPDRYPVLYSQMRGIYRGERVPFVGSFVLFMQSPAGWLCIILVVFAMIITPIIEKKLEKEKITRLGIILSQDESHHIDTEDDFEELLNSINIVRRDYADLLHALILEKEDDFDKVKNSEDFALAQEEIVEQEVAQTVILDSSLNIERRDFRTFAQKLEQAQEEVKERYAPIYSLLSRIEGAKVIESKKQRTFKKGNKPIARFMFKGKTLCVLFALDTNEYKESKYVFTDLSSVKAHEDYPLCMRLTSSRQSKWSVELLEELINKNGFVLSPVPVVEEIAEQEVLDATEEVVEKIGFNIERRDFRDFAQKLEQAKDEVKERYAPIYSLLSRIEGAKVIESKKQRTFKKGNKPIARFIFKGKTLCVLFALDTNEYKESKYVFTDLSSVKAHEDYPLCMRLTSTRQAKWSVELLEEIIARNGYKLAEIPVVEVEQKEEEVVPTVNEEIIEQEFVHPDEIIQQGGFNIERRDFRDFAQKLEQAQEEVKERYAPIYSLLSRIEGAKVIESKKQRTFKKGNKPIARFMFKGKTLCVLFALDTNEYKESKYVFTDLSSVKAHEDYPLCMRLTSSRQSKWSVELLEELINKNGYELSPVPFDLSALKKFSGKKLSFTQRLRRLSGEVKERYKTVVEYLNSINGIKEFDSKQSKTFRQKGKPIAKIVIKGKTVNVYLPLNPVDYEQSKYVFVDASSIKKYAKYPMRLKLTSTRQAKWTNELINEVCATNKNEKGDK